MNIAELIRNLELEAVTATPHLLEKATVDQRRIVVGALCQRAKAPGWWSANSMRLLGTEWNDMVAEIFHQKVRQLLEQPVLSFHHRECALVLDDLLCIHEGPQLTLDLLVHLIRQQPSHEVIVAAYRLTVSEPLKSRVALHHAIINQPPAGPFTYRAVQEWIRTFEGGRFPFSQCSRIEALALRLSSKTASIRTKACPEFVALATELQGDTKPLNEWTLPAPDGEEADLLLRRLWEENTSPIDAFHKLSDIAQKYFLARLLKGMDRMNPAWHEFAGAVCFQEAVDALESEQEAAQISLSEHASDDFALRRSWLEQGRSNAA